MESEHGGGGVPGNDYSTYRLTSKERLRYYAVCAPGLAFLGFLYYDSLLVAGATALCSIFAEGHYAGYRAGRRRKRLAFEFRDLLLSLSSSFATGRHMKEALAEAVGYLEGSLAPDSPMLEEVRQLNRRLGQGGESEKEALADFAARSGCEDIASFVDVYFTCLDTGGDLIKAVGRSAETLIEKIGIEKELEALTAQKKYESIVLGLMPIIILAFLRFSSPGYVAPLYGSAAGMVVMTLALALLGVALVWSGKILRTEI
jgi:tight adherence protein B